MQKIVVDTNVLVSSLIQTSYPHLIIRELFINEEIQLCISDKVMLEYFEVLNRPKFNKYPDFINKAEIMLAEIERKSKKYYPRNAVEQIKDQDDNKFLELAWACKAKFLITGNTNDFTMQKFKTALIVSPRQYWEKYRGM